MSQRTCRAVLRAWPVPRSLLALALPLIFILPLEAQSTPIGHVAEIDDHGSWYVYADANSKQGRRLQRWQEVAAGGVIRIESPQPGDHIALVDVHLNPLASKTCDTVDACYQPIFLPREPTGPPDDLSVVFHDVFRRLLAEPYQPSMHRVRGAAERRDEGVALLEDGKADLAKVMQHMPQGKYSLQPYRGLAARDELADAAADVVHFDWNSQTALVLPGNWKAGLYEISLMEPAEEAPTLRASVRVLLCSMPQYANLLGAFERAQALTEAWGGTVSPETVHTFLRAYLAELAESRTEKRKL